MMSTTMMITANRPLKTIFFVGASSRRLLHFKRAGKALEAFICEGVFCGLGFVVKTKINQQNRSEQMKMLMGRWKRGLLALVLAAIAAGSITGCIWRDDHDHGHDDHHDMHDEHHDDDHH